MENLSNDGFPEPRKVFLGFLIQRLMDIEEKIYLRIPPSTSSVKAMMGLIDSLSSESKDKLSKEYEALQKAYDNGIDVDLHRIFRDISSYLHQTYLKEIHTATPQFKRDKPLVTEQP